MNQLNLCLFHPAITHISMLMYHLCHAILQHTGTTHKPHVQIKCIKLNMIVEHSFVL